MNIFDSKVLMQWKGGNEVGLASTPQKVPDTMPNDLTDGFPTLLNIPWSGEETGIMERVSLNGNVPAEQELTFVEADIVEDVGGEQAVADLLAAVQTGDELPGGELAKAIAHVLTLNSNLSVSIDVEQPDPATEKQKLMDRYQEVSSSGTGAVFSWSSQFAPNLAETSVSRAAAVTAEAQTKGYSPEATLQMRAASGDTVSQSSVKSHAVTFSTPQGSKAELQSRPDNAKPNIALAEPKPMPQNSSNVIQGARVGHPEQSSKSLSEFIGPIRQMQVASIKNENHISFLQPALSTQIPDLISRVATGMQASGAAQSIESFITSQPSTKAVARIEVQLVPKNLGTVNISVQKQDGMISILIRTETVEAEKLLNNESTAIRETLKSAGLTLDEIRIQPFGLNDRDADVRNARQLASGADISSGLESSGFSESESQREANEERSAHQANAATGGLVREEELPEEDVRTGLYL